MAPTHPFWGNLSPPLIVFSPSLQPWTKYVDVNPKRDVEAAIPDEVSLEWILTKRSQVFSLIVLLAYVDSFSASRKVADKGFKFKRLWERLTEAYLHYTHRFIVGKSSKQVVITSKQPKEAPHKRPFFIPCTRMPRGLLMSWAFALPAWALADSGLGASFTIPVWRSWVPIFPQQPGG